MGASKTCQTATAKWSHVPCCLVHVCGEESADILEITVDSSLPPSLALPTYTIAIPTSLVRHSNQQQQLPRMAEEAPANVFVPPTKCLPKSPFAAPPLSMSSSGWMTRLLIPLALLSYLLSLPVLGLGVWLLGTRDYNCEDLMQAPQIRTAIGVGLILVFTVSNAVVYLGPRILMPGHVILSVVLVVMLSAGVSLVGLYKAETRGLPGTPMWLRSRVMNAGTWVEIKNCLYDDRICLDIAYRSSQFNPGDFIIMKLSAVEVNKQLYLPNQTTVPKLSEKLTIIPSLFFFSLPKIKSGCCRPPEICGMEYVNATYWTSATRKDANDKRSVRDPTLYGSYDDCHVWSNDSRVLCYNCQSCKTGFVRVISSRWKKVGVFLMVMSILFVIVHTVRFTVLMLDRYSSQ
ncbi:hypothetical protein BHE74_00032479 [Ensete ventricosum]|nr:hypothetical protein BHE74_00032479 [Ensete ventricosum]